MREDFENAILRRGMKNTTLADIADVSNVTVGRWRKNPDSIPFGKVEKLANAQGYSVQLVRTERTI